MDVNVQDYTNPANYAAATFEIGFNATKIKVQMTTDGPGNIHIGFGPSTAAIHCVLGPTTSIYPQVAEFEIKGGVSAIRAAISGGNASVKILAWL